MKPLGVLFGICLAFAAATAFGQRDASSKVRGEYNFYGNSGSTSMRSAQEHVSHYREYVGSTDTVNPAVAKESSDTIGDYIVKSQKHMASMRKHAKDTNDKQTLTELDAIDKHLAEAAKHHADLKAAAAKPGADPKALTAYKSIDDSLSKAIAEHDKLMKRLGGAHSAAPKK